VPNPQTRRVILPMQTNKSDHIGFDCHVLMTSRRSFPEARLPTPQTSASTRAFGLYLVYCGTNFFRLHLVYLGVESWMILYPNPNSQRRASSSFCFVANSLRIVLPRFVLPFSSDLSDVNDSFCILFDDAALTQEAFKLSIRSS
jgi:hypothetical protein